MREIGWDILLPWDHAGERGRSLPVDPFQLMIFYDSMITTIRIPVKSSQHRLGGFSKLISHVHRLLSSLKTWGAQALSVHLGSGKLKTQVYNPFTS